MAVDLSFLLPAVPAGCGPSQGRSFSSAHTTLGLPVHVLLFRLTFSLTCSEGLPLLTTLPAACREVATRVHPWFRSSV